MGGLQFLLSVEVVAGEDSDLEGDSLFFEGLIQAIENAGVEIALQLISLSGAHLFEVSEVLWQQEQLFLEALLEGAVERRVQSGFDICEMSEDEVLRNSVEELVDVEDISKNTGSGRSTSQYLFQGLFLEQLAQEAFENFFCQTVNLLLAESLLLEGLLFVLSFALSR